MIRGCSTRRVSPVDVLYGKGVRLSRWSGPASPWTDFHANTIYLRNPGRDFELELTVNHGAHSSLPTTAFGGTGYGHDGRSSRVDDLDGEHTRFEGAGPRAPAQDPCPSERDGAPDGAFFLLFSSRTRTATRSVWRGTAATAEPTVGSAMRTARPGRTARLKGGSPRCGSCSEPAERAARAVRVRPPCGRSRASSPSRWRRWRACRRAAGPRPPPRDCSWCLVLKRRRRSARPVPVLPITSTPAFPTPVRRQEALQRSGLSGFA